MKKYFHLLVPVAFAWLAISCGSKPFFSDSAQWKETESDFTRKKAFFADERFFSILEDSVMNRAEREAMTFLYAYMPIGDITDYSGAFYLENVRQAFQAKEEMPWGKDIPEKEFRHFVLPVRVNNENLDSSRMVFYAELKDRVKGLSLYDAVLEVNHWCHEKAIYTPSDARTSSPLATVKTAYGRCGEESTFLVAALRSVCIPARQVYTPRWAHTDDNHAWVEAYVDGEWHFLGACEPEPVLDLAWFNDPVARGMLMHTKVFGKYPGPEDIMQQTPCYTEINVIDNYADAARVEVEVKDEAGKPLPDVEVEFKLYNYAEFYTVARKRTDAQGRASLSAGKGDMLVWAAQEGKFGFSKVSFGQDSLVSLVLDREAGEEFALEMDIVPPVEKKNPVEVSAEQRAENTRRMQEEDSIRNAYVSGFYNRESAMARCMELGLDTGDFARILVGSRGNHAQMDIFMEQVSPKERPLAVEFLKILAEKDWRDAPADVLLSHFQYSKQRLSYGDRFSTPYSEDFYIRYVMNPRVAYENLSQYKEYFSRNFPKDLALRIKEDPAVLVRWINDSIRIENGLNPLAVPVSPQGVYEARLADSRSRDIFFVSLLRSLNVAARINPLTSKPQYALQENAWHEADFGEATALMRPAGKLKLDYKAVRALPDPRYYSHFSLSCYEDGRWNLLSYPEDASSTWKNLFSKARTLDAGYYLLVSGTRLAGGSVLARLSFFPVEEGGTKETALVMRDDPEAIKVIGSFNSENKYQEAASGKIQSILECTGRGYFGLAVLGAGEEPSNHALRDLVRLAPDLEAWGRPILLLFPDEAAWKAYLKHPVEGLPSTVRFGIDQGGVIEKELQANLRLQVRKRPVFIIGDTFNRVVYASQGYNTSLGNMLERIILEL